MLSAQRSVLTKSVLSAPCNHGTWSVEHWTLSTTIFRICITLDDVYRARSLRWRTQNCELIFIMSCVGLSVQWSPFVAEATFTQTQAPIALRLGTRYKRKQGPLLQPASHTTNHISLASWLCVYVCVSVCVWLYGMPYASVWTNKQKNEERIK